MPISKEIVSVRIQDILMSPDRQRQEISYEAITSLADSIGTNGLIHPILITASFDKHEYTYELVAGLTRLKAHEYLGLDHIQARLCIDPSPSELIALELEENIKRTNLPWQDEARAVKRYHDFQLEQDPSWIIEKTAAALSLHPENVMKKLRVAKELDTEIGTKLVSEATSIQSAFKAITRDTDRAIAAELDLISSIGQGDPIPTEDALESDSDDDSNFPTSILNENFLAWAKSYSGPRFNFIHCDFPYGIGMDKANLQSSSLTTKGGLYEDSAEIYWSLLEALFDNLNTICASEAHIIFWLSGSIKNIYSTWTEIQAYNERDELDLVLQPFPLIWHKSDGVGIIPDSERYGRRTYETALFITRGDRKIVRPKAISVSRPSEATTRIHSSEKPQLMLEHFFEMVVDSSTRMLDPTCGSGSSLRAAEKLGASYILGLELNSEYALAAEAALLHQRLHLREIMEIL